MNVRAMLEQQLGSAYRIERELGGGGMSHVLLAEETALGRRVVVKVLPPEASESIDVERFRREIQLVAARVGYAVRLPRTVAPRLVIVARRRRQS
ncbi:MAG: hypothetical protein ABMA00_15500 [Gemmatimonas sp.]